MNRAKSDVSAAELKSHTTSSTISPKYRDGLPFDVASTNRGLRGAGDSLLLCSISFFDPEAISDCSRKMAPAPEVLPTFSSKAR
jgi:hypothetical protein